MNQSRTYLPKPKVAERYAKTVRTIDNWTRDKNLGFPQPIIIKGREHFPINGAGGLDEWDAAQAKPNRRGAESQSIAVEREAA